LPLFQYIGHYERFIEGVGIVVKDDIVELAEKLPGFDWITANAEEPVPQITPVAEPESNPEPVPAPPASNETPESPSVPEAVSGPVPASASVAAVVH